MFSAVSIELADTVDLASRVSIRVEDGVASSEPGASADPSAPSPLPSPPPIVAVGADDEYYEEEDDEAEQQEGEPNGAAGAAAAEEEGIMSADAVADEEAEREFMLEELFDACDDDGSGALSLEEFAQILDNKVDEEARAHFSKIDVDVADGKLTKAEFVAYHKKVFSATPFAEFAAILAPLLEKAEETEVIDEEAATVGERLEAGHLLSEQELAHLRLGGKLESGHLLSDEELASLRAAAHPAPSAAPAAAAPAPTEYDEDTIVRGVVDGVMATLFPVGSRRPSPPTAPSADALALAPAPPPRRAPRRRRQEEEEARARRGASAPAPAPALPCSRRRRHPAPSAGARPSRARTWPMRQARAHDAHRADRTTTSGGKRRRWRRRWWRAEGRRAAHARPARPAAPPKPPPPPPPRRLRARRRLLAVGPPPGGLQTFIYPDEIDEVLLGRRPPFGAATAGRPARYASCSRRRRGTTATSRPS